MSTGLMRHPHVRKALAWGIRDWRGPRYLAWGGALLALTSLVTLCYYANVAHPGVDPDTPAYLGQARHILDAGRFVDPARLPGYPTLVALVFLFTGRGNLGAVSALQAILYVLATLELYATLCLVIHRAWVAALIALPVAVNTHLLSYMRPVLSEGLALFLVMTLALALIIFLRWPGPLALVGVTSALLALFLTRPEWMYLPAPLFACLLLFASRRGLLRRLLPVAAVALGVLYGTLGGYVVLNRVENSCTCVTYISNLNLLGKVMEYRMEREAPPQYDHVTRLVAAHLARGDADPWNVIREDYPPLQRDYYALAGDYSLAIIRAHPVEFVAKSAPVAAATLTTVNPFRPIDPNGPFAPPLLLLNAAIETLMRFGLRFFPLLGAGWLVWALWPSRGVRRASPWLAEAMGLLALLGGYGLTLTVFGGYVYFARLRAPYAPLLLTVVWGSAVLAALWLGGRARIGGANAIAQLRKTALSRHPASSRSAGESIRR
jgi:hypothetical protein